MNERACVDPELPHVPGQSCGLLCVHVALWLLIGAPPPFVSAEELTLDQKLIVACYRIDVTEVVQYLRAGANANAIFGHVDEEEDPLTDPWVGSGYVGSHSWTPLLALAQAPKYPEPRPGFAGIWASKDQVEEEQARFERKALEKRRAGELTILYILLSHGAEINRGDCRNGTALHWAVDEGKTLLVKALLEFGANPNTKRGIYIDGSYDITPLHSASSSKELLQLLLDHGADASAKDSEGRTPVDWVGLHRDRDFDLVVTLDGARIQARDKPK